MASTERNAPCPCGSGKKYKHCHGTPEALDKEAAAASTRARYQIHSILFSPELAAGTRRVVVNGALYFGTVDCPFMMILKPLPDHNWEIEQFGWKNRKPRQLDAKALGGALIQTVAEGLSRLSVAAQGEEELQWMPLTEESQHSVHQISYRPALTRLQSPDWRSLWDRISTRIDGDEGFQIPGFDGQVIRNALEALKPVYPFERLKKIYQHARDGEGRMTSELTPADTGNWFPAFHLAGMASGVLCRDPAWHYLVDLGLAIATLRPVQGRQLLLDKLAVKSALQHQTCLASELYLDNRLLHIDAETDLHAKATTRQNVRIRTVEADSLALAKEIPPLVRQWLEQVPEQDDENLPPRVLHVIARGNEWYQGKRKAENVELEDLPAEIAAVVISHRFVDASGGHVQRHIRQVIINSGATQSLTQRSMERLFQNSGSAKPKQPCLNFGTYFPYRSAS